MNIVAKPRILCIDNSEESNASISFALSNAGYIVETAKTSIKGIELARKGIFALYIMNLASNPDNRSNLIKEIREIDSSTPILTYLTDLHESMHHQAIEMGAQLCLGKPVEMSFLVETVNEIIDIYGILNDITQTHT